ncbi:hypothetical protein [Clostridium perfringens]|jgi:hypothetical protein|uniref:Uncharacterized protein n=1 Tax=Clostridium perfringens TaxID=1502 RepID=A0AAW4IY27_CLOPF|nr:hypothetical protein [Clostridium perfringens]MBO3356117.1 hypothetical protein [Clostridium perfringens]MBO3359542.1 hypothetical protein [Clostridium perfringens]
MSKGIKLLETIIQEYKYESVEERMSHVEEMIKEGWICDGQVRKSDDPLSWHKDREYYWFARFQKINK